MAKGYKTGGRSAGTPNRNTLEVETRLAALGCDPIEGMARLAMDENNAPELRGRMYAELGGYCYPKRRAIEFNDVTPSRPLNEMTDEELSAVIAHGTDPHGEPR